MQRLLLLGLLLAIAASAQTQADIAGFFADEQRAKTLRLEAAQLATKAHGHLDAGNYREAESTHRSSKAAITSAEAIERDVAKRVGMVASNLIAQLGSETFAERKTASFRLATLGTRALPFIEPHIDDRDPERRIRLQQIVKDMGSITYDKKGRLQQWAVAAKASTEYSNPNWAAQQATGAPDTPLAGDYSTAWAPKGTQVGMQWLELTYSHAVVAQTVGVVETYNPGAVRKLEARDAAGKLVLLWEGKDSTRQAPATFEIDIPAAKQLRTQVIRITLDTNAVNSYNEIDAVRLNGKIVP